MSDEGKPNQRWPDEKVVRVVCSAQSHREITVANYRRLHDDDPRYTGPVWVWDEAMAQGGSKIEGELRMRESIHRRKVTAKEAAKGRTWAEAQPKRFVRDLDKTSDDLECGKCGDRLTVNRERLEKYLDKAVEAGVSTLHLHALAAIVRK